MRYDCHNIRRQDRLLDESRAREVLQAGEYGVLSMATEQGGYGVPINYVLVEDTIYLHCAPDGRKLRALSADEREVLFRLREFHIVEKLRAVILHPPAVRHENAAGKTALRHFPDVILAVLLRDSAQKNLHPVVELGFIEKFFRRDFPGKRKMRARRFQVRFAQRFADR